MAEKWKTSQVGQSLGSADKKTTIRLQHTLVGVAIIQISEGKKGWWRRGKNGKW